jgi:hypothetical protein
MFVANKHCLELLRDRVVSLVLCPTTGAAQAQPRQSKFGPAVISAPLNAQPLSAEAAQAAAAAFVRQHMGVSGQTVDQKKKMLWGGSYPVVIPVLIPLIST